MANDPNSSPLLTQAYLGAARRALRPGVQPAGVVDLGEFDSAMEKVFSDE